MDKLGTVKWFNGAKGFGFIECDGEDYFAHFRSIAGADGFKTLEDGAKVKFTAFAGKKGAEAHDITVLR